MTDRKKRIRQEIRKEAFIKEKAAAIDMKQKKTGWGIVLAVLILLTGADAVRASGAHTAETPYNWYCKNREGNVPPDIAPEFSFIGEHGGYWLDEGKKNDTDDKVIYLTFDAGYENGNVEKILDALKKHQATGAFFVLSNLVTTNTDLVKRMKNEGHLICNHTSKHKNMTRITDYAVFEAELRALEQVYFEKTGEKLDPFYRPPEGCFSEENLDFAQKCGYKTIFWSYAYADWDNKKQLPSVKAKDKVLAHTHNGMVLLLHPTSQTNAEIMDELLTEWEREGYRFGSLYELTGS